MLIIVSAIVIVAVTIVLLQVDNFSRDFTQNDAETSVSAKDPLLRPQQVALTPERTAELIRETAQQIPRWEWGEQKVNEENATVLHFTRTTPLFRFVDDIHVTLTAIEEEGVNERSTRIEIESQSRVGKGDLGQNPRNIKELMKPLLAKLEAAGAEPRDASARDDR